MGESKRAIYERYLRSPEWQARRAAASKRADGRCQLCYSPDKIEVHHRTYLRLGHEYDMDLTVLCGQCHEDFHGLLRKRQRDVFGEAPPPIRRTKVTDVPDYLALDDEEEDR